jgi:hypothetical protein
MQGLAMRRLRLRLADEVTLTNGAGLTTEWPDG